MNKNRRSSIVSYIIFIALIGVISSILSSDFPIGALIWNLKYTSLEVLLDQLSFGLGFVAAVCLIAFLFLRSLWMKNDDMIEGEWEEDTSED
jgi:hypothetical protein